MAAALALAVVMPLSALAAITGQLQGVVTDAATGRGLAGVTVSAAAPSGRYHVSTHEDGSFTIVGIVPDTYTVAADAAGYQTLERDGVTIQADTTVTLPLALAKVTRVIGRATSARSASSAFQPNQTEDAYSFSGRALETQLGKAFNVDQKSLLTTLPSVTVDNKGGIFIRGGFAYQVAYQYEGIDYTEPTKSLEDAFSNVGNFNQLSGIGSVQIIPGGGDATHGNTGTGLVAFQAKRGTYPATGLVDLEAGTFPYDHQLAFEYGIASKDGRLSNYVTYTGVRKSYQYGPNGAPTAGLGYNYGFDPTTVPGYTASPINAILSNTQSIYDSPSSISSNTLLDNLVYKFGRDNRQSIQFFIQNQVVRQLLNAGGYAQSKFYSSSQKFPDNLDSSVIAAATIPLYPGQTSAGQFSGEPDDIYSPFEAYKFEYSNNLNDTTFLTTRFYRTFNDSIENQPSQGIYIPQNGGIRTAFALELSKQVGSRHFIEVGGKYEYVHPFGERSYVGNFEAIGQPAWLPFTSYQYSVSGNAVAADFAPPGLSFSTTDTFGNAIQQPIPAGYLNKYFPNGVPRLPGALLEPTTDQQNYGLFAQDTVSIGDRLRATLGIRLDGYNLRTPDDPSNPPETAGLRHQRLYEPHVGLSERLSNRDALRFTYGRTLSIPLASLVSFQLSRAPYAPFAGIPTNGPATYCGPKQNQTCTDYADQLYWIERDFLYPPGSVAFTTPLKGATYTNYDFSYSHEFGRSVAAKVTPFFRRGYDIIEASQNVLGYDPVSRLAILGIPGYTNQGLQKASGVEFLLTKEAPYGLSGSLSATYLNQLGNDVPGTSLTQTSLALGDLYRSPNFAPLQTTLALTYRSRSGFRINPIIHVENGYPTGIGAISTGVIGNRSYNLPATDSFFGYSNAYYYTDPVDPGSFFHPNIVATRGTSEGASAGSFLSRPRLNSDVTFEYRRPGSSSTFGIAVTNLFDQLYGIPVNNPTYRNVIVTGVTGPANNGQFFNPGSVNSSNTQPSVIGVPGGAPFVDTTTSTAPYIIFPNKAPRAVQLYYQLAL